MEEKIMGSVEKQNEVNEYVESELGKPSNTIKYKCDDCKDTGFCQKIEWTGDDDSHEVEIKCGCQED